MKPHRKNWRLVKLFVLFLFATHANAVLITPTVTTDTGNILDTAAITALDTTGARMAGMEVTASFGDGSTETVVWMANTDASTPASGLAVGTSWEVRIDESSFGDGSTFRRPFVAKNTGVNTIIGLLFDGLLDTVFDIGEDKNFPPFSPLSSPGSALGRSIEEVDGPGGLTVDATYRNAVAVKGMVFGDIFSVLDLVLGGMGLGTGESLQWMADTDTIGGDPPTPIPEPTSMALFGLALAGFGARTLRGKRAVLPK